jgi:hypothetical protein
MPSQLDSKTCEQMKRNNSQVESLLVYNRYEVRLEPNEV